MGLSAKAVEKLARDGKAGLTNDGKGLYFKVTKTGSTSWIFRYKMNYKSRDMGLGPYPEIGLAEAREHATRARLLILEGKDPLEVRRDAQEELKRAEAAPASFKTVAEEYIDSHRAGWKSAKHAQQWANTLSTYAYPVIGHLAPSEIKTQHILEILKKIWKDKTETASRVRNRIELVLDAAKARGLREGENPARWRGHLDKLLPRRSKVQVTKHHPALPWKEVPTFMANLSQLPGSSYRAMEMTILTATRTSEVLNAQWSEIDLADRVWTIPAVRMKTPRDHRVPISDALLALLVNLPRLETNPFLFPGLRPGKPLTNMAMLMALSRMGNSHLTMHGFRSSFRDWAGEATSHPRDVCEQALAHTIGNAVEAAYRRGDLFEKRRLLMQEWSDFIFSGVEAAAEMEVS